MSPARSAALVLLLAGTARAELAPDRGLELGGRTGYAVPLGDLNDGPDGGLARTIRGMVPLWLDLGYRVAPELMFGAWLQTGFGFMGSALVESCEELGLDCSVFDLRLGVQGQYHFRPVARVDPWVGLGFGYEWLTVSSNGAAGESTLTHRGWEFLNVQGGVDFLPRKGVGIGPFASLSLGRYDTIVLVSTTEDGSEDVEPADLHYWLVLGVRGTFVL